MEITDEIVVVIEVVLNDMGHAHIDIAQESESVIALLGKLIEQRLFLIAGEGESGETVHVVGVIVESEFLDLK